MIDSHDDRVNDRVSPFLNFSAACFPNSSKTFRADLLVLQGPPSLHRPGGDGSDKVRDPVHLRRETDHRTGQPAVQADAVRLKKKKTKKNARSLAGRHDGGEVYTDKLRESNPRLIVVKIYLDLKSVGSTLSRFSS